MKSQRLLDRLTSEAQQMLELHKQIPQGNLGVSDMVLYLMWNNTLPTVGDEVLIISYACQKHLQLHD